MVGLEEPRDVALAFAEALNAGDAEAVGAIFSEDAEFTNILGMRMRQQAGIVAGHRWAFDGPLRGRRITFDLLEELRVTDDVVIVHGHSLRSRRPGAPEQGLPDGATVLVFVTRRGADGWEAVAATNVAETPPPS